MLDNIPGIIAIFRFREGKLTKIQGQDILIDLDKLSNIIMENMRIGENEAKELKFLESFRGFAMILDDIGVVFVDDYLVITNAKKTNWDLLIKAILKGEVIRSG
ncbi:DUF2173 family protein [Saccharolobus islandicus]|uniref:Uncharacterized protein n=3 Tax=Saccharolobus islandicus TaxID=43080 RepID=C4KEY6_SACI6|nr:DUF2173 family protein [Sulfolobus islandicus]ACP39381.1 conserved hypothetical protein [Sulfolobus islandicus M.14.25]ACP56563.1 conserved hypothetical protein [Sulfolobus islandicus M.16.27]ACR43249.1 conserved hypothetical protein [Sulfolobus islandicus M.16.4]